MREPLQHWGIGKLTVPVDAVLKVIPSNSPHSLTSVGRRVREHGVVGRKTPRTVTPSGFRRADR